MARQTPAGCGSRIRIRSILSETPVGPLSNLFMVADGMGGHKAGDFASRFVVDTMVAVWDCTKATAR